MATGTLGDGDGPALEVADGPWLEDELGTTAAPVGDGDGLGSHAASKTASRARAARRRAMRCIGGMVGGDRPTGRLGRTAVAGTAAAGLV
jgi:hypothetical protein